MAFLHHYESGPLSMTCMAWSPDGHYLVTGATDSSNLGEVFVWKMGHEKPRHRYQRHLAPVYTVDWSPDGSKIASAGQDGAVHVWSAPQGDILPPPAPEVFLPRPSITIRSLDWSPDSAYVAAVGHHTLAKVLPSGALINDRIYVWKVDPGPAVSLYRPGSHPEWFLTTEHGRDFRYLVRVGWFSDGTRLASLCLSPYGEAEACIWQSPIAPETVGERTHSLVAHAQDHCTGVDMAWSPDGTSLAVTYGRRHGYGPSIHYAVEVWDWASETLLSTYAQADVVERSSSEEKPEWYCQIAWSPDGKYLASTWLERTIVVWETLAGKEVYRYQYDGDSVIALTWSPDSSLIASLDPVWGIEVWDLQQ